VRVFCVWSVYHPGLPDTFRARASGFYETKDQALVRHRALEKEREENPTKTAFVNEVVEERARRGDLVTLQCGTLVKIHELACGQGSEQHQWPKGSTGACFCGFYPRRG
jgi:hypothetical protein